MSVKAIVQSTAENDVEPTSFSAPTIAPRTPGKLRDHHKNRLAIVYVRQSSPQQVIENRESRERQYALAAYAVQLGWNSQRVIVIDEDQGLSGRSAENRTGFQRLLAEVSLNHVGLVLGLELSRLARSSKDWHHLVEVCAIFDTLLGDQDGLYDACDGNDRLLLGMKGAMSEFELITLRNRLERGRDHKAARGDLVIAVPVGYLKLPAGEVVLEPDEQARENLRLVFETFRTLGSIYQTCRYFADHRIALGFRNRRCSARGELTWKLPTVSNIQFILHHPIYTGAYAYGLRGTGHGKPGHRPGSTYFLPPDKFRVLIHDRFPAYITWEQYLQNQRKLQENRPGQQSKGTSRVGPALLPGLIRCGRCGRRYFTSYRRRNIPYYHCQSHREQGSRPVACGGLAARQIDELVARQVLIALTPAALEVSLRAAGDLKAERTRLHDQWRKRLERSSHEVDRAARQYHVVEPENRLVARTLEERWETALRHDQQLREDHARFLATTPHELSDTEIERLRVMAGDVRSLWDAPATTHADRTEIVRCLVDKIITHVHDRGEYVDVTIHWHGGYTSQHEIARSVHDATGQRDYDRLAARIRELHNEGLNCAEMAQRLNDEGFVPPRRRGAYSKASLSGMLRKLGIVRAPSSLGPDEWWSPDLAEKLAVRVEKLYYWAKQGYVHARRTPQSHWIIWADDDELCRLMELRKQTSSWIKKRAPELLLPKPRPAAV